MKIDITQQQEQPSFQRSAIKARLFSQATSPSRQAVADALADKLSVNRELVIIEQILPAYGDTATQVTARVYTDKKIMHELERANLIEKNKPVKAEVAEEEPETSGSESDDSEDSKQESTKESQEEPAEEKPAQ